MDALGIICEYNPFHAGHQAMLKAARSRFGAERPVVCAMSGNFVQRGEPAVMDKHVRAAAAVKCGADLVLELPVSWAVSSAERFAHGGVSLLAGTGLDMTLCFGSECGNTDRLKNAAAVMDSDAGRLCIAEKLQKGMGYAAAMQEAADRLLGDDAAILKGSNDLLGIEYIKAVRRLDLPVDVAAIPRVGPAHDGDAEGEYASATFLRGMMARGEDMSRYVPSPALELYKKELALGRAPVAPESLEQAMLYRLRTMTEEEYSLLPDGSEGLYRRLMRFAGQGGTVREILDGVKTKRYAYARLRRMVIAALLGVTAQGQEGTPPYLRVLAFNSRGQEVLHEMRKTAALPIVIKPAAAKELDSRGRNCFVLEARADDIYALAYTDPAHRAGGAGWRRGPEIVR